MVETFSPFRPRYTLRSRFTLVIGILLAVATINIAASAWGARERRSAFGKLQGAIERHSTVTELRAEIEDQYKRVKVASDLVGIESAPMRSSESARVRAALGAITHQVSRLRDGIGPGDSSLVRITASADSLVESWQTYYDAAATDPARAIAEVTLRAEPMAQRLLREDLPTVIVAEHDRVAVAVARMAQADAVWFRFVWMLLLISGIASAALAYRLSRDFGRALETLKRGARQFGSGALKHRLRISECGELQELATSFNEMAINLKQTRDDLEQRNADLAHLAFRDPLTKLANRALFRESLENAFARGDRSPGEIAILFVDLDDFKAINDTYGHEAGDLLLVDVAHRLLDATRGSDTVARLGGDEFGVLLHRIRAPEEATVVANRVIASLQKPYVHLGIQVKSSASIGVAHGYPGEGAPELMRNADLAMYRAKSRGRGLVEVFHPEMHTALVNRTELESDLRGAVARNELVLEYQPIVDLRSRRILAFEALLRWHHPKRGLVSPTEFIPLAEENGDIISIGRWALEQACRDASTWPSIGGHSPPSVTVNVSARQLEDSGFAGSVAEALAASRIPPSRLVLEITESVIVEDDVTARRRLWELKQIGVRLAIDDFGTGYSSLASLQRFPVDILKIDKAFVVALTRGDNERAIARTIVALGEALSLQMVAEGIEHEDQRTALIGMGCHEGQGYLFARPVPGEAVRRAMVAAAVREVSGLRLVQDFVGAA